MIFYLTKITFAQSIWRFILKDTILEKFPSINKTVFSWIIPPVTIAILEKVLTLLMSNHYLKAIIKDPMKKIDTAFKQACSNFIDTNISIVLIEQLVLSYAAILDFLDQKVCIPLKQFFKNQASESQTSENQIYKNQAFKNQTPENQASENPKPSKIDTLVPQVTLQYKIFKDPQLIDLYDPPSARSKEKINKSMRPQWLSRRLSEVILVKLIEDIILEKPQGVILHVATRAAAIIPVRVIYSYCNQFNFSFK